MAYNPNDRFNLVNTSNSFSSQANASASYTNYNNYTASIGSSAKGWSYSDKYISSIDEFFKNERYEKSLNETLARHEYTLAMYRDLYQNGEYNDLSERQLLASTLHQIFPQYDEKYFFDNAEGFMKQATGVDANVHSYLEHLNKIAKSSMASSNASVGLMWLYLKNAGNYGSEKFEADKQAWLKNMKTNGSAYRKDVGDEKYDSLIATMLSGTVEQWPNIAFGLATSGISGLVGLGVKATATPIVAKQILKKIAGARMTAEFLHASLTEGGSAMYELLQKGYDDNVIMAVGLATALATGVLETWSDELIFGRIGKFAEKLVETNDISPVKTGLNALFEILKDMGKSELEEPAQEVLEYAFGSFFEQMGLAYERKYGSEEAKEALKNQLSWDSSAYWHKFGEEAFETLQQTMLSTPFMTLGSGLIGTAMDAKFGELGMTRNADKFMSRTGAQNAIDKNSIIVNTVKETNTTRTYGKDEKAQPVVAVQIGNAYFLSDLDAKQVQAVQKSDAVFSKGGEDSAYFVKTSGGEEKAQAILADSKLTDDTGLTLNPYDAERLLRNEYLNGKLASYAYATQEKTVLGKQKTEFSKTNDGTATMLVVERKGMEGKPYTIKLDSKVDAMSSVRDGAKVAGQVFNDSATGVKMWSDIMTNSDTIDTYAGKKSRQDSAKKREKLAKKNAKKSEATKGSTTTSQRADTTKQDVQAQTIIDEAEKKNAKAQSEDYDADAVVNPNAQQQASSNPQPASKNTTTAPAIGYRGATDEEKKIISEGKGVHRGKHDSFKSNRSKYTEIESYTFCDKEGNAVDLRSAEYVAIKKKDGKSDVYKLTKDGMSEKMSIKAYLDGRTKQIEKEVVDAKEEGNKQADRVVGVADDSSEPITGPEQKKAEKESEPTEKKDASSKQPEPATPKKSQVQSAEDRLTKEYEEKKISGARESAQKASKVAVKVASITGLDVETVMNNAMGGEVIRFADVDNMNKTAEEVVKFFFKTGGDLTSVIKELLGDDAKDTKETRREVKKMFQSWLFEGQSYGENADLIFSELKDALHALYEMDKDMLNEEENKLYSKLFEEQKEVEVEEEEQEEQQPVEQENEQKQAEEPKDKPSEEPTEQPKEEEKPTPEETKLSPVYGNMDENTQKEFDKDFEALGIDNGDVTVVDKIKSVANELSQYYTKGTDLYNEVELSEDANAKARRESMKKFLKKYLGEYGAYAKANKTMTEAHETMLEKKYGFDKVAEEQAKEEKKKLKKALDEAERKENIVKVNRAMEDLLKTAVSQEAIDKLNKVFGTKLINDRLSQLYNDVIDELIALAEKDEKNDYKALANETRRFMSDIATAGLRTVEADVRALTDVDNTIPQSFAEMFKQLARASILFNPKNNLKDATASQLQVRLESARNNRAGVFGNGQYNWNNMFGEVARDMMPEELVRKQFTSEKFAQNYTGDRTYNGRSVFENYLKARDMQNEGMSSSEIFEETEYEIGLDGKLRLWVPTADAEFDNAKLDDIISKVKGLEDVPAVKLGELISVDSELFKGYPHLADITVRFKDSYDNEYSDYGSEHTEEITISPKKSFELHKKNSEENRLNSREAVKIALMHEVQHAIQTYEGMAQGVGVATEDSPNRTMEFSRSNDGMSFKDYPRSYNANKDARTYKKEKMVADSKKDDASHYLNAGEMESRYTADNYNSDTASVDGMKNALVDEFGVQSDKKLVYLIGDDTAHPVAGTPASQLNDKSSFIYNKDTNTFTFDVQKLANEIYEASGAGTGKLSEEQARFCAEFLASFSPDVQDALIKRNLTYQGGYAHLAKEGKYNAVSMFYNVAGQSENIMREMEGARGLSLPKSARIILGEKSDVTTVLHESFHLIFWADPNIRDTIRDAIKNAISEDYEGLRTYIDQHLSIFGSVFSEKEGLTADKVMKVLKDSEGIPFNSDEFLKAEEAITSLYESWVYDGKSEYIPSTLEKIFNAISNFFKGIYKAITGQDLYDEIDMAFASIFDNDYRTVNGEISHETDMIDVVRHMPVTRLQSVNRDLLGKSSSARETDFYASYAIDDMPDEVLTRINSEFGAYIGNRFATEKDIAWLKDKLINEKLVPLVESYSIDSLAKNSLMTKIAKMIAYSRESYTAKANELRRLTDALVIKNKDGSPKHDNKGNVMYVSFDSPEFRAFEDFFYTRSYYVTDENGKKHLMKNEGVISKIYEANKKDNKKDRWTSRVVPFFTSMDKASSLNKWAHEMVGKPTGKTTLMQFLFSSKGIDKTHATVEGLYNLMNYLFVDKNGNPISWVYDAKASKYGPEADSGLKYADAGYVVEGMLISMLNLAHQDSESQSTTHTFLVTDSDYYKASNQLFAEVYREELANGSVNPAGLVSQSAGEYSMPAYVLDQKTKMMVDSLVEEQGESALATIFDENSPISILERLFDIVEEDKARNTGARQAIQDGTLQLELEEKGLTKWAKFVESLQKVLSNTDFSKVKTAEQYNAIIKNLQEFSKNLIEDNNNLKKEIIDDRHNFDEQLKKKDADRKRIETSKTKLEEKFKEEKKAQLAKNKQYEKEIADLEDRISKLPESFSEIVKKLSTALASKNLDEAKKDAIKYLKELVKETSPAEVRASTLQRQLKEEKTKHAKELLELEEEYNRKLKSKGAEQINATKYAYDGLIMSLKNIADDKSNRNSYTAMQVKAMLEMFNAKSSKKTIRLMDKNETFTKYFERAFMVRDIFGELIDTGDRFTRAVNVLLFAENHKMFEPVLDKNNKPTGEYKVTKSLRDLTLVELEQFTNLVKEMSKEETAFRKEYNDKIVAQNEEMKKAMLKELEQYRGLRKSDGLTFEKYLEARNPADDKNKQKNNFSIMSMVEDFELIAPKLRDIAPESLYMYVFGGMTKDGVYKYDLNTLMNKRNEMIASRLDNLYQKVADALNEQGIEKPKGIRNRSTVWTKDDIMSHYDRIFNLDKFSLDEISAETFVENHKDENGKTNAIKYSMEKDRNDNWVLVANPELMKELQYVAQYWQNLEVKKANAQKKIDGYKNKVDEYRKDVANGKVKTKAETDIYNDYLVKIHEAEDEIKVIDAQGKRDTHHTGVYTAQQFIDIYLMAQQEGGMEKLITNPDIDIKDGQVVKTFNKSNSANLSIGNVLYVMDKMLFDNDYAHLKKIADAMQDIAGERQNQISDVLYRSTGQTMDQVKNYFMFVPDSPINRYGHNMDLNIFEQHLGASVALDSTKDRKTGAEYVPNLNSMDLLVDAIYQQEHYIFMKEKVSDMQKMFSAESQLADALRYSMGDIEGNATQKQLEKFANAIAGMPVSDGALEKAYKLIRNNKAVSSLWGSFTSVLQQFPTALFTAIDIGFGETMTAIGEYMHGDLSLAEDGDTDIDKFIYRMSAQMEARARNDIGSFKSQRGMIETMVGKRFDKMVGVNEAINEIMDIGLAPLEYFDKKIANMMWYAYYKHFRAEYASKFDEGRIDPTSALFDKAVYDDYLRLCANEATQKVLDISPNDGSKDNALVFTSRDNLVRNVLLFTNQLNKMFNVTYRAIRSKFDGTGSVKRMVKTLAYMGLITAMSSFLAGNMFPSDKDKEKGVWGWIENAMKGWATDLIEVNVPVFGDKLAGAMTGDVFANRGIDYDISNLVKVIKKDPYKRTEHQLGNAIMNVAGDIVQYVGGPSSAMLKTYRSFREQNLGYMMNSKYGRAVESLKE